MSLADTFRRDAVKRTVSIHEALELVHVVLPEGALTQQVSCPFHADTHPSARVYDDHLYCFTCGQSWDTIDLVQRTYGMTYLAAIEWLESEFRVAPADADPVAVIRATLRAPVSVSLTALLAHVDAQLVAARDRLTCAQYARYTTALDVIAWQLDSRAITVAHGVAGLRHLLTLVTP